jgi:hypothetical protein
MTLVVDIIGHMDATCEITLIRGYLDGHSIVDNVRMEVGITYP